MAEIRVKRGMSGSGIISVLLSLNKHSTLGENILNVTSVRSLNSGTAVLALQWQYTGMKDSTENHLSYSRMLWEAKRVEL